MAPALAFYFSFTSAARLNRQNQIEPLILAISLVIIGVCANIFSIFAIDSLPGLDAFGWITSHFGNGTKSIALPPPAQLGDVLRSYVLNLAIASFSSGVFGFALSKLIVWGLIDTSIYHGPMYPMIRGFVRHYIVTAVVTRLEVERKRYGVYSGMLDHLVMSRSQSISLVALAKPAKSLFSARRRMRSAANAVQITGFPPGITLSNSQSISERLLIEGEDIRISSSSDQAQAQASR